MTFLSLKDTYGWQKPFPPIDTWPWRHLNLSELVGLNEVTADSIDALAGRFASNDALLKDYLIKKGGYNSSDPVETEWALQIYEDWKLITDDRETYPYLCAMQRSLLMEEYKQCLQDRKPRAASFL